MGPLLFLALPIALCSAGADKLPTLGENAALHYWQAIALMPESGDLSEDQKKTVENWQTAPPRQIWKMTSLSHSTRTVWRLNA